MWCLSFCLLSHDEQTRRPMHPGGASTGGLWTQNEGCGACAESSEPQALPPKAYKDSVVNLTPAAVPA